MSTHTVLNPKYPNINIPLVGEDGNAFAILGRVSRIMKRNNLHHEWDEFRAEATSGDYDKLLLTVMTWFAHDEGLDIDDVELDELDLCDDCGEDLYDCECED